MGWLDLTEKEYLDYDKFRSEHGCVSQREITIVPDAIAKSVHVRCLLCGEKVNITDYDSA